MYQFKTMKMLHLDIEKILFQIVQLLSKYLTPWSSPAHQVEDNCHHSGKSMMTKNLQEHTTRVHSSRIVIEMQIKSTSPFLNITN